MPTSSACPCQRTHRVYLIDTNVISEARKQGRANSGVLEFLSRASRNSEPVYLSVVTIGELRRGIELMRHRTDVRQADLLERWLEDVIAEYDDHILGFDADAAQVWGRLQVPSAEHAIDKQIAATALVHDLTVVTRNEGDFEGTGVRVINPFR